MVPPTIPGLPELRPIAAPVEAGFDAHGLTLTAGPRTDWFVDANGQPPKTNAPALVFPFAAGAALSAAVAVDHRATFDAGVLVLWQHDTSWAKLCFERSPQGELLVVSVVTRGISDDANAVVVPSDRVWLRVSRVGRAFAFHHSFDGRWWHFTRYFALAGDGDTFVGFEAQSPTGEGCTATFTDMSLGAAPTDLRDGS
jgi:regulation of enolase protein 1 (concanavalin A-like superfamily)